MAKIPTKTTSKKAASGKGAARSVSARTTTAAKATKAAKAPAKSPAKSGKKPATSAAKTASSVLTIRHIAETLSAAHEIPKRQANEMLNEVIEIIAKTLKKGGKIRLSGLGILQVRKRAARMGRNPQTGEAIKIKASKKIAFTAAKDLKQSI
jgi:DNA-binding protein HU-beta